MNRAGLHGNRPISMQGARDGEREESKVRGSEQEEPGTEEEQEQDDQGQSQGRALKVPGAPSQRECEEQLVYRWPRKGWCEYCLRGRAKPSPHKEVSKETAVPIVGIDDMWKT